VTTYEFRATSRWYMNALSRDGVYCPSRAIFDDCWAACTPTTGMLMSATQTSSSSSSSSSLAAAVSMSMQTISTYFCIINHHYQFVLDEAMLHGRSFFSIHSNPTHLSRICPFQFSHPTHLQH